MELKVTKYNFIKARMKRLEEAYKQSCDHQVRNAVKEKTFYEIAGEIDDFYEKFGYLFETCKMSSLMEITKLTETVMSEYSAIPLPTIEISQAKRILKLKERDLNNFVKAYNQVVSRQPLTYYSQIIDQKIVFLTQINGEFVGTVGQITKDRRNRESLCAFCRKFRRGDEIVFVTTSTSAKNNAEYSVIGQYCCSDYNRCNNSIEDSSVLDEFVSFAMVKKKERNKRRI